MIISVAVASVLGLRAEDKAAAYPGGKEAMDAFIAEKMVYPETAKENGIEGVVTVLFIVKSDGSIADIKIKRLIDADLENESVRIVKEMPKWIPGEKEGKAVDSPSEVDITFSLD